MSAARKTPAIRFLLIALAAAATAWSQESKSPAVSSGPAIGLRYRSLQPGETLLVSLDDSRGVRHADVRFGDDPMLWMEPHPSL